MRMLGAALLIAAGIGAIGASSGSATPANSAAVDRAASAVSLLSQAGYVHWHGHTCYAKCYYDVFLWHRVCRHFC